MKSHTGPKSRAEKLIETFLSSETIVDIVLLFRSHPELIATEELIASKIGQCSESINMELKRLAKLGTLRTERTGKQIWFGFDAKRDKQIQTTIENYLKRHQMDEALSK